MKLASRAPSNLITLPSDLASVESIGPEDDPRAADARADAPELIWAAVQRLYETGMYPAISLCVRRRGKTVIQRAIGHRAGNEPGSPLGTPLDPIRYDTPFCLFSASKAVTATVIHKLDELGHLRMDDPVAEFIPEFAANGKRWVTIRHVLTHRSGIPLVPGTGDDVALLDDWDGIVKLLCEARPVSRAGKRLSYHAITGGFVLGEIVRRITGMSIREYFDLMFAQPLGLKHLSYGVAESEIPKVAVNSFTGRPVPLLLRPIVTRALGVPFEEATRVSNLPVFLKSVVPAGNVIGSAWDTARFFEMLVNGGELDGRRVLEERTIRRATVESSYLEVDYTLAIPVRNGLGYMLGGEHLSLYGSRTRHAFGHLGFMNIHCWADPDRDLSAALLTSGKPFISPHLIHLNRILNTIGDVCPMDW
jgi:CubicO group peptidase (beta-lactamase class C family)